MDYLCKEEELAITEQIFEITLFKNVWERSVTSPFLFNSLYYIVEPVCDLC